MEKETLEKYKKAGKINAKVVNSALKMTRPGTKLIELAEFAENEIVRLGGKPAFPVNISINDIAAHYTPTFNDVTEIKPGDIVKIDIGTHVDGYIGDMAASYCSEKNDLVDAAKKVLDAAVSIVKPGVTPAEIGAVIEGRSKDLGVGVIVNLTGHGLDRFVFHGSPPIPNVGNGSEYELQEWDVIAIEPFITNANSQVKESGFKEIHRYVTDKPVRMMEARQMLAMARDEWNQLPFSKRWLAKKFSPVKIAMAIRQLEQVGAIESYPALKHVNGEPIAQAEHTVIVRDKPIITTIGE
ncbi:MAG: type II methionyl aminopeptidase [Candidatus Aenigmatarchaeota archaeon]